MPQVHCYLPTKIVEQLEKIKQVYGHTSLSKTVKAMIDLGIQDVLKRENESQENDDEKKHLEQEEQRKQHTMYLHKILSLNTEIFRCVYDKNKLSADSQTVEEKIVSTAAHAEDGNVVECTESWVFPLL